MQTAAVTITAFSVEADQPRLPLVAHVETGRWAAEGCEKKVFFTICIFEALPTKYNL